MQASKTLTPVKSLKITKFCTLYIDIWKKILLVLLVRVGVCSCVFSCKFPSHIASLLYFPQVICPATVSFMKSRGILCSVGLESAVLAHHRNVWEGIQISSSSVLNADCFRRKANRSKKMINFLFDITLGGLFTKWIGQRENSVFWYSLSIFRLTVQLSVTWNKYLDIAGIKTGWMYSVLHCLSHSNTCSCC